MTGVPLQAHHTNKLANLKRRWQGRKQKPEWVRWMISRHQKPSLSVIHVIKTSLMAGTMERKFVEVSGEPR
jgi:hypothetical protein